MNYPNASIVTFDDTGHRCQYAIKTLFLYPKLASMLTHNMYIKSPISVATIFCTLIFLDFLGASRSLLELTKILSKETQRKYLMLKIGKAKR